MKNWNQRRDIYFAGKLPWPWSPLLPPGSVKVLRRWRCHNGRQCAGGWTRSERQSGGERKDKTERERSREVSWELLFSTSSFLLSSLFVVFPTCSSHMKHRRWPKRKRLERKLTRHRKKKMKRNKNKQEDSSPNQLNTLRHVTPMQLITHKHRKMHQ